MIAVGHPQRVRGASGAPHPAGFSARRRQGVAVPPRSVLSPSVYAPSGRTPEGRASASSPDVASAGARAWASLRGGVTDDRQAQGPPTSRLFPVRLHGSFSPLCCHLSPFSCLSCLISGRWTPLLTAARVTRAPRSSRLALCRPIPRLRCPHPLTSLRGACSGQWFYGPRSGAGCARYCGASASGPPRRTELVR